MLPERIVSDSHPSLFGDMPPPDSTPSKSAPAGQLPPQAAQTDIPSQRMFISGDLSGFHLPDEALKTRRQIPPFWKGFLFPVACGSFILVLIVLISMSDDGRGQEGRMSETVFVSDGVQTEFSHVSQLPFDSEECYDVNLDLSNSESYMWIDCWSSRSENIKAITIERNAQVAVFYDGDNSTTFTLPFAPSYGADISFTAWQDFSGALTNTHFIGDGMNRSFIVDLPADADTEDMRVEMELIDADGSGESYWFNRGSDCYYSGSRCTMELYYNVEEGFWDPNSKLLVVNLTTPLENGATLELVYWDYSSGDASEMLVLFFWLPPLIYIIGVISMFATKNNQVGVGALVGLIPTFPVTLIAGVIISEMMYY